MAREITYVTFECEGEQYGIPVAGVEVVLEGATITPVPHSLDFIRGVMNHRGTVVPVLDLRRILRIGETDLTKEFVVLIVELSLNKEMVSAGLITDKVYEVLTLSENQIDKRPSIGHRIDGTLIAGIGKGEGGFIILLDLQRALEQAL
ncbi:MAG TPA: chemotaxis protein CheW [Termitinemataceae bacterium]|uniref:chemotaxis protein CheW n=1 Tax=Treponema sp. J25 TaxID=2094121 RepID=UPI001049AC76|nr:chemotaxis protein CheW [Treponema sp. J25]TCW62397.1 chemotaxis protein CheW [Treponema sp. J25]HOJ98730.1 chemotaxis protein CheW [Termitinemataceae bacterium]HOM23447.1 chemotaxis protein CheW [Termitinemataceae bacterium]HPQ00556.1 chemotaxis protein CheW [Termitinemataceae bacterium]